MKSNHQHTKFYLLGKILSILTSILLLFGFNLSVSAQSPDPNVAYLVVTENDSTQILFPVLEKPVITLDGTTINIVSKSRTYSAEIPDILDFTFIDENYTTVNSILSDKTSIELSRNTVTVKGISSGDTVYLYNTNGIAVGEYRSNGKPMTIDLNQLIGGIYILSTKNANYKIKK